MSTTTTPLPMPAHIVAVLHDLVAELRALAVELDPKEARP